MNDSVNEFKFLKDIIKDLTEAGCQCFIVGGWVIDNIRNRESKDIDIEVYKISYQVLTNMLSKFGKVSLVGKSFGIVKLSFQGWDLDFNIPRNDRSIGIGHKDFEIVMDPDMDPKEAARRRDFTINSLYQELIVENDELILGDIIDHFGGLKDLENGVLRATDPTTFVEDPLRALRAMQILARKCKTIDPDTLGLCGSLKDSLSKEPKERLYEEFHKLLMKAKKPSVGIEYLKDSGLIDLFPELKDLIGCEQNIIWHPEGDVWVHSLRAVDFAAMGRDDGSIPEGWEVAFMFGVLLHDIGKPSVTTLELRAHGHAEAGEPISRQFMERLTTETDLLTKVTCIVKNHMRSNSLSDPKNKSKGSAWKRLHNCLRLDVAGLMGKVDACASSLTKTWENDHASLPKAMEMMSGLSIDEKGKVTQVLMGRHLILKGHNPGIEFKQILDRAYEYQLDTDCEDIEILYNVGISK